MDARIYDDHILQEKFHWWFLARRAVVNQVLSGTTLPKAALILDAGCGSGGNFALLSQYGKVFGMEPNAKMLAAARQRGKAEVEAGQLPDHIPFPEHNFDVVTLFDVLEHIEDDTAALTALAARMNRSGLMVLTLPAFPFLYSRLDKLHHHYRRYSKKDIRKKLEAAGLQVEFMNYWNVLLFPVAVIVRMLEALRMEKAHSIGSNLQHKGLNRLIAEIVAIEGYALPHIPMPFGLSLLVMARKR